MKLRIRLTLLFSLVFSALIIVLNVVIYYSFAEMRKDEFYLRLKEKSTNTLGLLSDVDDIDHELLRVIDQNTVNALYQEKTLVFDENKKLLYSSIDNHPVNYSNELLDDIQAKGEVYYTDPKTNSEVFGIHKNMGAKTYYVLSTAYDRYGIEKLNDIGRTLMFTSLIGVMIAVAIGYWLMQKGFKPLETLNQNVRSITESNLSTQVPVANDAKDEISQLAQSYNQMLLRLSDAFDKQKTFVQHASHELRTPVSAMMSEVEVALQADNISDSQRKNLLYIRNSLDKISDLINSLLLLSKVQNLSETKLSAQRVDEIIFSAAETVSEHFPDFKPIVHFQGNITSDSELEIPSHRYLLKILFVNLMENGYKYATDGKVEIIIHVEPKSLSIHFKNDGATIPAEEQRNLFTPFFRSTNVGNQTGHGLGLSVAQRIATYHLASLSYTVEEGINLFKITFNK